MRNSMRLGALPDWLQAPQWILAVSDGVQQFVRQHEAAGLFTVIGAEELGIPLPVPGDIAILWAGYLMRLHRLSFALALLCVVAGATLGSTVLFTLSRRLGHPFLSRYGRYIGVDARRLARAEDFFLRFGPWAIVLGRLIPGFRIVISAFAGTLNVPYSVFVPSVMASALIWALVLLELGTYLGPTTMTLVQLFPAHLLPLVLLLILALAAYLLARKRSRAARAVASGAIPESEPTRA